MGASPNDAVFRFESPEFSVEFEGPEDFVTAQIEFLQERLRRALGDARQTSAPAAEAAAVDAGPAPVAAAALERREETEAASPTLAEFYESAHSREGRGALQEKILVFAYYLTTYGGKPQFSIDSLDACFSQVGATPPRSLANTLGILKRSRGLFRSGGARGQYALTDSGLAYVRRLIGAQ